MSISEFAHNPVRPRRGMTSIEAAAFLQKECPQADGWACWYPRAGVDQDALARIPAGRQERGTVGAWTWRRVPLSYPCLQYWHDGVGGENDGERWAGLIEVCGEEGEEFLVFSYLCCSGTVGSFYMTNAAGRPVVQRFARDVAKQLGRHQDKITVSVWGGQDIHLDPETRERVLLPSGMKADIEEQVDTFFGHPEVYRGLELPYRRGLLFVGPPGNGKTMMLREVVRRCWRKYRPAVAALSPGKHVDEGCMALAFGEASGSRCGIVILEEVDALVAETEITRAALLGRLDGLSSAEGVLVLATTNNPENVDPALMHRPSRFDRVWRFELPDERLRREYLDYWMPELPEAVTGDLARMAEGWSFAYLNELRATAAVLALQRGSQPCSAGIIQEAFDLLQAQFRSGAKNHKCAEGPSVGFRAA